MCVVLEHTHKKDMFNVDVNSCNLLTKYEHTLSRYRHRKPRNETLQTSANCPLGSTDTFQLAQGYEIQHQVRLDSHREPK